MRSAHGAGSSRLLVEDLFAASDLGLRLVAGARGANKVVLGVHISELPEPTRWLSPGDVLLTTGLSIKGQPDLQRRLVRILAKNRIAAVGFGVGVCMHGTPAAMIEEAEVVGLPLFEVPFETPFKAVTSFINDSLVSRNVYLLRRRLSVQAHLLQALLEGRGVDYLVSSLAVLLSATVVLFDGAGRVAELAEKGISVDADTAAEIWEQYEPRVGDSAADILRIRTVDRLQVVFRDVWNRGRVERVLAIVYPREEPVPEFTNVIASYVQKLLTLEALKSRQAEQLWKRMRGGLLEDLVFGLGRPGDLRDRAVYFGFDPEHDYVLIVCDPVGFSRTLARQHLSASKIHDLKDRLEDKAGSFFALRKIPILAMLRSDAVVIAAQLEPLLASEIRDLLGALRASMLEEHAWLDLAVGASEFHRGVSSAPRAFAEAQEAVEAAKREPEGNRVRLFADLGPTASFLFGLGPSRLRALVGSGLSLLERHDRENNDALVDTLRVYLQTDRNVREAASLLFIHPNTLRYRLRKAETVMGASLDSTRVLADLYLSFRAEALLRSLGPEMTDPRVAGSVGTGLGDDPGSFSASTGPDQLESGFGNLLVGRPAVVLPGELAAGGRRSRVIGSEGQREPSGLSTGTMADF